jgi:hypothetical protein
MNKPKKEFDSLPGLPSTGSDMAASPWGASSFDAGKAFASAQSAATPALAQSVAKMANQFPSASAGSVVSLARMGIDPKSQAAVDVINMDVKSTSEIERQKARELTRNFNLQGPEEASSAVDFLAPITRGFFITLSMPWELIDASLRNIFQDSKKYTNPFLQTQLVQIGASALRGEGINVGDGFLSVGQDTKIGQKFLEAKLNASEPGAKKVWNPAVGLTQALFDDPDTKAARTFEGISSFVWAVGADPLTYVPGVGLANIRKSRKLKEVAGSTTVLRGQAKAGAKIDEELDSISGEISELEDAIAELRAIDDPIAINELLELEDALELEFTKARAAEARYSILNSQIQEAEGLATATTARVTEELERLADPARVIVNVGADITNRGKEWLKGQDDFTRATLGKKNSPYIDKQVDELLEAGASVTYGSRYYSPADATDQRLFLEEGLVRESWVAERLGFRRPNIAERKRGIKGFVKDDKRDSLQKANDHGEVEGLFYLADDALPEGFRLPDARDVGNLSPADIGGTVQRAGKTYIKVNYLTRGEARNQVARKYIDEAEIGDPTLPTSGTKSFEDLLSVEELFTAFGKTRAIKEIDTSFKEIGIRIPAGLLRTGKDESGYDVYKRVTDWIDSNADQVAADVRLAVANNPDIILYNNVAKELFEDSYDTIKAGEQSYRNIEDLKELVAVQRLIVDDTNKTILSKEGRRNSLQLTAEEALQKRMGLNKVIDESVIDYNKMQEFLFGKIGESVMRTLVAIKDPVKIRLASNHKFSIELSQELARATTKEEVLQALSKNVGLKNGIDDTLSLATRARLGAAGRAFEFKPGYYDPKSVQLFRSQLNSFVNNSVVAKGVTKVADSKVTRFLPTTGAIHIDDVNKLVEEMDNGLVYFNKLKIKGKNEPVINQAVREKIIGRIINAPNSSARFRAWMDGIADVEIELLKSSNIPVDSKRAGLIKDAARIFGDVDTYRNFLAQTAGDFGAPTSYKMLNGGVEVPILPNLPLIDSQLTNTVRMPNVKEMRAISSKLGNIFELNASTKMTRDLVNELFGKRFKEFVLVGRASYIFRNVLDMQIRMYLTGNRTMFQNPLAFLSTVISDPTGGPVRSMIASANRNRTDVYGDSWDDIAKTIDATNPEAIMSGAVSDYAILMARQYSTGTGAAARGLPAGVRLVKPNERSFNQAWANSILMYRSGLLSRIAAGGLLGGYRKSNGNFVPYFKGADSWLNTRKAEGLSANPEDINVMVDFLYETAEGRKVRDLIANISKNYNFLSIDSTANRAAMKEYLNVTQIEIDNLTAKNQNLVKFIAGEELILPSGVPVSINPKKLVKGNTPQKVVAATLASYRKSSEFDSAVGIMKPLPDFTESAAGRTYVEAWNRTVRDFFRFSAQVEKTTSLGPQFQHEYWGIIAQRFPLLNRAEGEKVLEQATKSLAGFKIAGKELKVHPAVKSMQSQLDKLPKKNGLTLDDIHDGANSGAADAVAKLFYDANKAKQWAASLGIASPFIQAFSNTIALWGKLALDNPARTYKAFNVYDWLNTPEAGWVYQWTNENAYDPGQGFIFDDPQFGDKRFVMPILGDLISSIIGLIPGTPDIPKMIPNASLTGLNLAFQTELLPGIGPAISLPLGPLIKENDTWLAEQARRIIYPFGADAAATGPVTAFTPAWLQRTLNAFNPEWFKTKSQSTLKPIMGYLASTGEYGNLPLSEEMQEKLIRDANSINRVFSFWRGVTQNISPTSIRPDILAKDKDGELHVQFHIFNRFNQILAENPDDYSGSIAKTVDEYGPNTIFALVNNTRGGITPKSEAWNFFQKNRNVANKYPDTFALFFPGGEYSADFARWQERRGTRFRLTDSQINIEAARYLYNARKARLQEIEVFLLKEGADPKMARENYQTSLEELNAEFGGKPEMRGVGKSTDQLLTSVLKASTDPVLTQTPAGRGLAKYLAYRDLAFAETEVRGLNQAGFFQAKRAADVAEWLRYKGYQVIQEYPEFATMYWRVFDRETEQS